MDINISFTHTPDTLRAEKVAYRYSDKEIGSLIRDTLKELKENVCLYRKIRGGKVLGRMALIPRKTLAGKPEVKVIFPVTHFSLEEGESQVLWQAEIVIDDRDWLYQTGENFVVSMKNLYPNTNQENEYFV
jgi:hypothetical protein